MRLGVCTSLQHVCVCGLRLLVPADSVFHLSAVEQAAERLKQPCYSLGRKSRKCGAQKRRESSATRTRRPRLCSPLLGVRVAPERCPALQPRVPGGAGGDGMMDTGERLGLHLRCRARAQGLPRDSRDLFMQSDTHTHTRARAHTHTHTHTTAAYLASAPTGPRHGLPDTNSLLVYVHVCVWTCTCTCNQHPRTHTHTRALVGCKVTQLDVPK